MPRQPIPFANQLDYVSSILRRPGVLRWLARLESHGDERLPSLPLSLADFAGAHGHRLVQFGRQGQAAARICVRVGDHYEIFESAQHQGPDRRAIDDAIYDDLVAQMTKLFGGLRSRAHET